MLNRRTFLGGLLAGSAVVAVIKPEPFVAEAATGSAAHAGEAAPESTFLPQPTAYLTAHPQYATMLHVDNTSDFQVGDEIVIEQMDWEWRKPVRTYITGILDSNRLELPVDMAIAAMGIDVGTYPWWADEDASVVDRVRVRTVSRAKTLPFTRVAGLE